MRLGSSSLSSRTKSVPARYRKIAHNSQVDETLFGNSSTDNFACQEKNNETKAELVQLITKDLIRNIRIPAQDPSGRSIILSPHEYQRITSASQVIPKEEKEAMKQAAKKKKEEEAKAAEGRKQQFQKADLARKENKALTELEIEARDRAQGLMERANALLMEQEDEVKKLNQLILGAQCQATRDAQLEEKKVIRSELADEEKRLDTLMETDRRKALDNISKIDELRKQQRMKGKQQICDQIQRRLEDKQLEDEMKDQNKQLIRDEQERMNQEDLMALKKKREDQQRMQEEIKRINEETVQAREKRIEQEKQADLKDLEFMNKKMEREAEFEKEQKRIKKEKELEITRLRAQQEKAKDHKAEQDELRAKRNQEMLDREWRKKQKEQAIQKTQDEAMLKAARLAQVLNQEHCVSMEAGREKAEFDRLLKVQHEEIRKQKEKETLHHQKARRHVEALSQQVHERELLAIAQRREYFKEADRVIEEARLRQLRLNEIKEKKLKELSAVGLAEKYCSQVERKARAHFL